MRRAAGHVKLCFPSLCLTREHDFARESPSVCSRGWQENPTNQDAPVHTAGPFGNKSPFPRICQKGPPLGIIPELGAFRKEVRRRYDQVDVILPKKLVEQSLLVERLYPTGLRGEVDSIAPFP
jgi:hypothetical protein